MSGNELWGRRKLLPRRFRQGLPYGRMRSIGPEPLTQTLHMWSMGHVAQTEQLPPDPRPASNPPRPFANLAPRLRPFEGNRPEIGHALSRAHALERTGPA